MEPSYTYESAKAQVHEETRQAAENGGFVYQPVTQEAEIGDFEAENKEFAGFSEKG